MKYLALCVAVLICGCGDNDNLVPPCGERTAEVDGVCVPTMEVCGDGTVLIDGVCRDPATVVPNATEAVEPSDLAGEIIVPGIGEPGFVMYGCISPRDRHDR